MTPPLFTASFKRARAAVVPWVPQTSRPISSRIRGQCRRWRGGSQAEVHNAEGGIQAAGGLLGHQLTHAGNAESGLLMVSATTSKG